MDSVKRVRQRANRAFCVRAFLVCLIPISSFAGHGALAQTSAPSAGADSGAADGVGDIRARENTLAIWAGRSLSDNIGRTETPESGSHRNLGLVAGLTRNTARFEGSINADLEYRDYSGAYESETAGALAASALVDLVEDRFAWNFEDSLDQGLLDPFLAARPGNRETFNVFTHGPRLTIPFGRTRFMTSVYRSTRRYDESAQVDNDNDHYELELARQMSGTATVGPVAIKEKTEYLDDTSSEYEINRLFVRINKQYRNASLQADIGTNEIAAGGESHRDPLVNIRVSRPLGSRSQMSLSAAREFTDSGSRAGSSLDGSGSSGSLIVTAAPFERKNLELSYTFDRPRTNFSLRLGVGEEDYAAVASLDNDIDSAGASFSYRVSQRLDVGLQYDLFAREFRGGAESSNTERDSTAGAWLNCAVGRRFGVIVGVSRYERSGASPVQETRRDVRFSYTPFGSRATTVGAFGR